MISPRSALSKPVVPCAQLDNSERIFCINKTNADFDMKHLEAEDELVSPFNGISTFVGYLMLKPSF